jgi:hypothetical protein
MKVLFENWRKFLNEKKELKYFGGDKLVQFSESVKKGKVPNCVAKKMFKRLGGGSTREVFSLGEDFVLKVLKEDSDENCNPVGDPKKPDPRTGFVRKQKVTSNANEADLKMQQKYPDVFPKTYEVAEDFSWIVSERVDPIDEDSLIEKLGLPEPDYQWIMGNKLKLFFQMAIQNVQLGQEINESETYRVDDDATVIMKPEVVRDIRGTSAEELEEKEKEELLNVVRQVLKDPHIRMIFRAADELRIPPRELRDDNFGVKDGKLVILDASIWEERITPEE